MNKIAVLDLGTNTFHLHIVERNGKAVHTLAHQKLNTKLDAYGINDQTIPNNTVKRAVSVHNEFAKHIHGHKVDRVHAFGTSAFRNASNSAYVIDEIFRRTGINVEILSGEREAQLIYYGTLRKVAGNQLNLVMDIGGGSVEYIIGHGKNMLWLKSYEIGVHRLSEVFSTF